MIILEFLIGTESLAALLDRHCPYKDLSRFSPFPHSTPADGEDLAIGSNRQTVRVFADTTDGRTLAQRANVPEFYHIVAIQRGQSLPIWREDNRVDARKVALENSKFFTADQVPESHCIVPPPSCQHLA